MAQLVSYKKASFSITQLFQRFGKGQEGMSELKRKKRSEDKAGL